MYIQRCIHPLMNCCRRKLFCMYAKGLDDVHCAYVPMNRFAHKIVTLTVTIIVLLF